jgi:hypothetical protein
MEHGMRTGLRFSILVIAFVLSDPACAQDVPPRDVLDAILPQLRTKLPATGISFRTSVPDAMTDNTCRMQRVEMTTSFGGDSRTFSVLVDPQREATIKPKELLARISRMTVDADGATRAYHPDDPYGVGICTKVSGPGGSTLLEGVCALDEFSNAGVRLFIGSKQATKPNPRSPAGQDAPDLALQWRAVWPLIRDRKLKPVDLSSAAGPDAPAGYYMFYWKERNLSAFFSRYIIPQARDGYPCVHGAESRYPGYFVVATTLNQNGPPRADGCAPARYIDAEQIPFFVLPGPAFGHVEVGDIVVGQLKLGAREQIAFGIAADTGPFDQLGEGSIAFNQRLLGRSDPVMNRQDIESVDIDLAYIARQEGLQGSLAILVLGGTKRLLDGNYSRENVERIGRQEFARWNAGAADGTRRLDACIAQARIIPH